jgi:peptide/nickel transport system permease protein
MTQQQAAIEATGIPFRTTSDRPFLMRLWVNTTRFFRTKPLGGAGVVLILFCVGVAALAPVIQRYHPDDVFSRPNPAFDPELAEQALRDPMVRLLHPPEKFIEGGIIDAQDPSSKHWLGTDRAGRDLYARIVWGARLSLLVGIGAALIAVSAGLFFGIISAYFGGLADLIIQRFTDALLAFPGLILLLLIVQIVDSPSKYWITLALGILGISQVIRIVRSAVLSARQEQYVLAAEVVGNSDARIMIRHILPNILAPTIVIFTISIGAYILAEAGLAFIGFGDPTAVSWGKMVNDGRSLLPAKPLMSLFAGGAITLTVLGFNLAGDALRDVLDPRLRGRGGRAGF